MFDIKSIEKYPKYPILINEKDGEHLMGIFIEKPLLKNTVRKFGLEFNGYKYFLMVELMLDENIGDEEIIPEKVHIIGKKFFLNREKI